MTPWRRGRTGREKSMAGEEGVLNGCCFAAIESDDEQIFGDETDFWGCGKLHLPEGNSPLREDLVYTMNPP